MSFRLLLTALILSPVPSPAADIVIDAGFPGGNVVVGKIDGSTVHLSPDLRGGQQWFHWCFDAEAALPGGVTFDLGKPQKIGVRGPAVSTDGGKSWRWLGAESVELTPQTERFRYEFTAAKQRVRFAVAIPYLQHDLDAFLKRNADNKLLVRTELAKTRKGTPVDLLRIGTPGDGVRPMLVTARHHACESTASYVLEGFMQEALSDSPAALQFRKRYLLFAVPIVDKDGVQDGDQGKNRAPHDHNRDYGDKPMFPEVLAIQELVDAEKIFHSIDFHCPALRGDIHEAFHFLGLGVPHIKDNLNEWIAWIREERPQAVMAPLNLLVDAAKPNAVDRRINSHYMATRKGAMFSATLEVPYTQVKPALDPAMARAYGAGLLRAWVRTSFLPADSDGSRGDAGHASLQAFRTEFLKLYRSKPKEMEDLAARHRADSAPGVYRVEAANLLGTMRVFQKQFAEAKALAASVLADPAATTQQRMTARVLKMQAACGDPRSTAADVATALAEGLDVPYPADDHRAKLYDLAADFARRHQDHRGAIDLARKQIPVAAGYERGRLWNRIAADYDALGKPEVAVAAREEAVKLLKPALDPVPVSVFGAMMTVDYFDALNGIPDTPLPRLKAAAQMVFDHKVNSAEVKERVRKALAGRE